MTERIDRPQTAAGLARKAGVSRQWVASLCNRGKLECTKVGPIWVIEPEEARRWLRERESGDQ